MPLIISNLVGQSSNDFLAASVRIDEASYQLCIFLWLMVEHLSFHNK